MKALDVLTYITCLMCRIATTSVSRKGWNQENVAISSRNYGLRIHGTCLQGMAGASKICQNHSLGINVGQSSTQN